MSLARPFVALLALPLVLAACGGRIDGDSSGGGSSSLQGADGKSPAGPATGPQTGTGSPTPAQPPTASASAVARTRAQNDALWAAKSSSGGGSSSGSSGGDLTLDPNDLFISFSDGPVMCSEVSPNLPCGGHWSVSLGIPPALQQPGVYDLSSDALTQYSSMNETTAANSATPGDCGWGGGSLGGGTLEILSIDSSQVRFRITLAGSLWDIDPSGEYTALRCP